MTIHEKYQCIINQEQFSTSITVSKQTKSLNSMDIEEFPHLRKKINNIRREITDLHHK